MQVEREASRERLKTLVVEAEPFDGRFFPILVARVFSFDNIRAPFLQRVLGSGHEEVF